MKTTIPATTAYPSAPLLSIQNAQLRSTMHTWQQLDACPACDSVSLTAYPTIRYIRYSRCADCGFTFSNPVPTQGALDDFYNSTFYSNYRRLEADRMERDRYFSVSMYTDMSRLASWLEKDRLNTVLDYGCGTAAFLAFLRDNYDFQRVEGIELSRAGAEIGQRKFGLSIVSSVQELKYREYDLVLLLEAIEHLPRPDILFKQIADLVKPGGRILITTPAVDNLLGRFFPSFCPHFTAPSHISMFTKKSISLFLLRFGMTIERLEIDKSNFQLFQTLGIGLLFRLDFPSPSHKDDLNGIIYVPNGLGKLLGLEPSRNPLGILGRILRVADRLIDPIWWRLRSAPRNEHLYVIARKSVSA
jgi:2-polyprenyl-3-methyl-5-hydroxy-6-metoxy-1,4-benzoquinol methylase